MPTELGQWGFTILSCFPIIFLLRDFWWPQDMGKTPHTGLIKIKKHFSVEVKVQQNPRWAVQLLPILL